jgi:hypothetical protein
VSQNECLVRHGEKVEFMIDFKLQNNVKWRVGGDDWYHLFQIKKWGKNRPLLTVGLKGRRIVVYQCESYDTIPVGKTRRLVDRWININIVVSVGDSDIDLEYNVNGKTGNIVCSKFINVYSTYVYMKFGQYRSYPNPIRSNIETVYKNIYCV